MPRHVAVDVETAQSNDHVIEIGLVEVVDGAATGREWSGRFRPTCATMNHFCQRTHGISMAELAGEPSFASMLPEIVAFVGDAHLVAHNRATEYNTLAREMARAGLPEWERERFACTMRLARDAGHPGGLRAACEAVGIPTGHLGERHAALEDARLCAALFAVLAGDPANAPDMAAGAVPVPVADLAPPVPDVPVREEPAAMAAPVPAHDGGVPAGENSAGRPVPVTADPEGASEGRGHGALLRVVARGTYGLALQRGRVPLVSSLSIRNEGEADLEGLALRVTTDPPVTVPFEVACDRVAAGSTLDVPCAPVPMPASLERVEESLPAVIDCVLSRGGEDLARVARPFRVLSGDEWPGAASDPELLAAFVRPNDRAVTGLLRAASDRLAAAGRDPSLDGYAGGSRERAWEIAEALYLAISDLGIAYALPPASFERAGQKVRGPSAVVGGRIATCLDTTLLYAACAEQAGLVPVLVLVRGHALCGVWLSRTTLGQCLVAEAEPLRRHVDSGDLVLVETTLVSGAAGFAEAARAGAVRVSAAAAGAFEVAVDVAQARVEGVLPLDLGTFAAAGADAAASAPREPVPFGEVPNLDYGGIPDAPDLPGDRLSAWKRKLLDLSLRNRLLNWKDGKGSVELLVPDVAALENHLSAGEDAYMKPRPATTVPIDRPDLLDGVLAAAFDGDGAVHSPLDEAAFERRLAEVNRAAASSLSEGGANTLFVAMGFLRWVPSGAKGGTAALAPLLLVPVALTGMGANRRPRVRVIQEEARFNPALLELLRQEFRIGLGGLAASLPRDASGIDVVSALAQVAGAVRHMPGWEVERRRVVLTTFSFTKFLMWKDLEERAEGVRESHVARLLLDGRDDGDPGPGGAADHSPDSVHPGEVRLPLPADASQASAVMAAHAGESFVMIGPPGTGKSQTIANIVANSLAHGRSVLFVSQKTAALQAVSRRLEDVGLGAHCLEVHSTKSGRNEVLGRLMETWRAASDAGDGGHGEAAVEVAETRDELNAFVEALHGPRENGMSARDAIARSIRARMSGRPLELDFSAMEPDPAAGLADARRACRDVEALLATFPRPGEHPLADVGATEWSPAWARSVRDAVAALSGAAGPLGEAVSGIAELGGEGTGTSRQAPGAAAALRPLMAAPEAARGMRLLASGRATRDALRQAATLTRELKAARRKLSAAHSADALELDLDGLSARWDASAAKGFVTRGLERSRIRKALAPHRVGSPPKDVGPDLAALREIRRLRAEVSAAVAGVPGARPFLTDGIVDLSAYERALAWRSAAGRAVAALGPSDPGGFLKALAGGRALPALERLCAAREAFDAREAALLDAVRAPRVEGDGWAERTVRRALAWDGSAGRLQAWCQWRVAEGRARAQGLGPLLDAVGAGTLQPDGVLDAFEDAHAVWFAERVVGGRGPLRSFVRARHEGLIARFREADDRLMSASRVAIASALAASVPPYVQAASHPEWLRFQGQVLDKRRNAPPLRPVFEASAGPIRALAPCMMMSPLSVAQYMPVSSRFDLVIFDEASQVTPWDALGALARGRQVIVVGDPKQLPPTDSMFEAEADDGEGAGIQAESVLDACVQAGMRSRHLRWHYRSRHESLIAFSKANYYPEMLTFPSPTTRDVALRASFVEGGSYDKGARVNRAEAAAVVADVVARLTDPAFVARGASLGIVTFNGPQMVLIEELLLDARRRRPEIDGFFDPERPEHVFVKNLESVQGDERDVILFSVTFSPGPNRGTVSVVSNLNRPGGERRLNVAITRARDEMVLFTSMRSADISVGSARGRGLSDFKAFLDYAERGPQALPAGGRDGGEVESVLEAQVVEGLRGLGWEVRPQVGVAGYRIDLGVVNPRDRGRYLAGVECDGRTYHRAASARDRDKLRQSVLEGLGWRIRRVWSTDWWHDPRACLAELDAALRADLAAWRAATPAADAREPAVADVGGAYAGSAAPATAPRDVPPPPDPARLMESSYRPILRRHVSAVIEAEWPVFQDVVVDRVLAMHGRRRRTDELEQAVLAVVERRFVRRWDGDRQVYWLGRDHVSLVAAFRDQDRALHPSEVPLPRLAGLAARHLAQAGDAGRAMRAMAEEMGVQRVSAQIQSRLQAAIDLARRDAAERAEAAGPADAGA